MNTKSLPDKLILASNSKYRKMLLRRLGIAFECRSPGIDEAQRRGETPADLAIRLAAQKASAICREHGDAIVIGSDQVATFADRVIGKPGNHAAAVSQLRAFSGRVVDFLTAVAVRCEKSGFFGQHLDVTRVYFRTLQAAEIERYLQKEKPYDCAGAFKAESLGITCSNKSTAMTPLR
jgi:septum formation protein